MTTGGKTLRPSFSKLRFLFINRTRRAPGYGLMLNWENNECVAVIAAMVLSRRLPKRVTRASHVAIQMLGGFGPIYPELIFL